MRAPLLVLLATLAVVTPAGAARAGEPGGGGPVPDGLTVERAVELALARHPGVRAARERLRELDAKVREARAAALPTVEGRASTVRNRDPGLLNSPNFHSLADSPFFDPSFLRPVPVTTYDWRVAIDQVVWSFGKIREGIRASRVLVEKAREEIRQEEADVARDAVVALYDLALAWERLAVLAAERASREQEVGRARDLLDAGAGTRLALLQARAALAGLAPRELEVRGEIARARARLAEALGLPGGTPPDPAEGLLDGVALPPPPPLSALLSAVDRRPEIRALAEEGRALAIQRRATRADLLPELKFSGTLGVRTIWQDSLADPDYRSWDAGIFLSWTLADGGRTRAVLDGIRSRERQNLLERERVRGEVARDLASALADYRQARAAVAAARESVAAAEEARRVAAEERRWGAATHLELLEADRALTEAHFQRLGALHDAAVALAELRALLGILPGAPLPGTAPPPGGSR